MASCSPISPATGYERAYRRGAIDADQRAPGGRAPLTAPRDPNRLSVSATSSKREDWPLARKLGTGPRTGPRKTACGQSFPNLLAVAADLKKILEAHGVSTAVIIPAGTTASRAAREEAHMGALRRLLRPEGVEPVRPTIEVADDFHYLDRGASESLTRASGVFSAGARSSSGCPARGAPAPRCGVLNAT